MADEIDPSATGAEGASGGAPPELGELVARGVQLVVNDFVPFLLGGLAFLPMVFLLIFVSLIGMYGGMFVGFAVGAAAGDEDLGVLLMMVGMLAGTTVVLGGSTALMAPMSASVMRAVWQQLVAGEKMTVTAPFATLRQDAVRLTLWFLMFNLAVSIGMLFLVVPALVVMAALGFAWPAMVVHRLPIGAAVRLSLDHFRQHPGWHLGFACISLVVALAVANIPLLGMGLYYTIHPLFVLLAYQQIFGTGPAPRGYEPA